MLGLAGTKLPKMKNLVKVSNENKISKFQKLALQPKQAKAVKGGEASNYIIVEELIEG
ncbi:MAG: hypothetical protein ACI85O_003027 [Saprospiraceae bacterium]|jgi:hypothetical protein